MKFDASPARRISIKRKSCTINSTQRIKLIYRQRGRTLCLYMLYEFAVEFDRMVALCFRVVVVYLPLYENKWMCNSTNHALFTI